MIRITKPEPPGILVEKSDAATRELCQAHEQAPKEYAQGDRTFVFDATLYGAPSVKEALREAQHRKCAFCESFFAHIGYGDVEHFRPKAGFKQNEGDTLRRPGYYWLAYAWENLFYSCQICNQRFKRNLFPLKDGRRRARSHRHALAKEEPLLIDPSALEPSLFIGFREEYAFARDGCGEGEATIEILGLNREELVEVRRDRLALLVHLVLLRKLLEEQIASNPQARLINCLRSVEKTLHAAESDAGEYAAMARASLSRESGGKKGRRRRRSAPGTGPD